MDVRNSGFIGWMNNDLSVDANADKGIILNARLLWTFSAMARFIRDSRCADMADYAYHTLMTDFWDAEFGGVFWSLDRNAEPVNSQKKTYGQAFLIYALSEYYILRRDPEAIARAKKLFNLIETHAYDPVHLGYFEVCERNWNLASRQQLSDSDLDAPKSMNTHLHLLEAYSHLYSVWDDELLAERLRHLVTIFRQAILDPRTHHFRLFFTRNWNSLNSMISFGHDIEGSWLLCRAAEELGDSSLLTGISRIAEEIADAVYREGLDEKYGLIYESDGNGGRNAEKHFWCQAEAGVGFINAFQLTGQKKFMDAAWNVWQFIEKYQIDREYGEWFWKLDDQWRPDNSMPKVSEWKCPYHSARACIEIINRLNHLLLQPVEKEKTLR